MSELLVTSIYNQEGEGAPSFPKGATVTGVITATSFSGSGANLTGIDATALKDGSGNVKIQANSTGVVVTGVVTATTGSFSGPVTIGGTLTYEDVTNIDSVGLITARDGIKVTGGDVQVGSAVTVDTSGINVTGVVTATSFEGNGANLTNLPPGGNTFTGIASGSIANNKCVMVCQDGKLAQITEVIAPATTPTVTHSAWAAGYQINAPNAAWNPRDKMTYGLWNKQNATLVVQKYFANVSTGTLADQGGTTVSTSASSTNEGASHLVYDTANNQLIVFYYQQVSGYGWSYSIATPSGTDNKSLTYGTMTAMGGSNSIYAAACCFEPTQGKLVVVYRDDGNGDDLYMKVGQVSDSSTSATITWGSGVQIDGTNNVVGGSRFDICSCGNSRVLFSWTRSSGNNTRIGAATITSGNGVTDITNEQLTASGAYSNVAWDRNVDKGVVTYADNNQSSYGRSRLVTLGSSNAITLSADQAVAGANLSWERAWMTYNAKVQRIYCQYQSNGGSGATKIVQADISGSTLTWANNTQLNGGSDNYGQRIASWNAADFSPSNSYGYITIIKNRQSVEGVIYVAKVVSSVANIKNQNQYIGFAAQAYTNGQTVTINTYGNNITTLSGLTTSSLYYVQGNGNVGLNADGNLTGYFVSGTPVAGTALNATTLLIRDPAVRV